jgi:hypothetical protein
MSKHAIQTRKYAAFRQITLGRSGELLYHWFPSLGSNARPSHPSIATRSTGMQAILDYLKLGGDRLDTEIAAATGMSLDTVRVSVTDLHARGEVMVCRSIRYQDGQEVDSILCRISGYIPPKAPGRKPSR